MIHSYKKHLAKEIISLKWHGYIVVLHFNWFYTVTYITCLLWIFDCGKLSKSLLPKHDRHTPSRIPIKKPSIRVEGNLKFEFCPYIHKILLQFSPILYLNDLWSKHTSCLDNAVCLYSMAALSKTDFALLLIIILDSYFDKNAKIWRIYNNLHSDDLWPNSGTLGHFQTWHPPLYFLKHIKIHFEHGCQNVLKNADRIFFQVLDGQLTACLWRNHCL